MLLAEVHKFFHQFLFKPLLIHAVLIHTVLTSTMLTHAILTCTVLIRTLLIQPACQAGLGRDHLCRRAARRRGAGLPGVAPSAGATAGGARPDAHPLREEPRVLETTVARR